MNQLGLKLRILARAEMALFRLDTRRRTRAVVLGVLGAGCALVALVFLNVGLFFHFAEQPISSRAAFILAGGNLLLAGIPALLARRTVSPEEAAIREIREVALTEVTNEVDRLGKDLGALGSSLSGLRGLVTGKGEGLDGLGSVAPLLGVLLGMLKGKTDEDVTR